MKVLCATDGSKYSRWTAGLLRHWPFPEGSSLVLVHVVDVSKFRAPKGSGKGAQTAMREGLALVEKAGRGLLERTHTIVKKQWPAVKSKLLRGDPVRTIVREAGRQKADLIMMGSRGLTDFRPFLLGSVARRVVLHAPCPVLVVKKRTKSLRRIIVGTDGSREASASVDFLLQMPLPDDASISVACIVPPLPIEDSGPYRLGAFWGRVRVPVEKEAQRVAKREAEQIKTAGHAATALTGRGQPAAELVKLTESEDADLLVVGSRGLGETPVFLMGSISDAVVRSAPCCVLVYRRQSRYVRPFLNPFPASIPGWKKSGVTVERV